MLRFDSDYMEGCCPEILKRLMDINFEKQTGYGCDGICESAKKKIRIAAACPDADIFFVSGGTQTNSIVIKSVLKMYEGVITAETGHINGHEAGAIEAGGHKVLSVPSRCGKLSAEDVRKKAEAYYADDNHEHTVKPGMVYISHPTEYGTLYTADELKKISDVCREYNMPLYLDGARLGYGLAAYGTDVTLPLIAKLCDIFYIGGTKVGAMLGEAVVFTKKAPEGFFTIIKQSGALLAKGWIMGVQFDTLFTDNLYYKIGRNAVDRAVSLRKLLEDKGYKIYIDSPTNQQFVVLETGVMEELKKSVSFGFWEVLDKEHTVVRFATSWATTQENIEALGKLL